MKSKIKSIISLALALIMVLSLAACGGNTASNETSGSSSDASGTQEQSGASSTESESSGSTTGGKLVSAFGDSIKGVFDEKNIVLTFPMFSDVHISGSYNPDGSYQQFVDAISIAKSFATKKDIDMLCVAGDMIDCTNSDVNVVYNKPGYPATFSEAYAQQSKKEREIFLKALINGLGTSKKFFYCTGNHDSTNGNHVKDFITAYSGTKNENFNWLYGSDLDKEGLYKGNRHIEYKGYHFIALECDTDADGYKWLDKTLADITKKNANQTIFVLHHYRPKNLTNFTKTTPASVSQLTTVLEKYPQVILFGGHSHTHLDFENALMQSKKGFINVDCGSVSYIDTSYLISAVNSSAEPINGSKQDAKPYTLGLLVEVDKSGNVRISRINFKLKAKIGQNWIIPATKKNGSRELLYTSDRAKSAKIEFTSTSATAKKTAFGIEVEFPAAASNSKVYRYEFTLKNNDTGATSGACYATSYFYKYATPDAMPHTYKVTVPASITLGSSNTVNIIATDEWGNKSKPISVKF